MTFTGFAALNAALARTFVVDREFFEGTILIAIAFQAGLVGVIRGRGRARRFWVGFEVAGAAGVLAGIASDEFPGSIGSHFVRAYIEGAANLAFSHLDASQTDLLLEYQACLFAVIYLVPLLLAGSVGGSLAAIAACPVQIPGDPGISASRPSTPAQSRS